MVNCRELLPKSEFFAIRKSISKYPYPKVFYGCWLVGEGCLKDYLKDLLEDQVFSRMITDVFSQSRKKVGGQTIVRHIGFNLNDAELLCE